MNIYQHRRRYTLAFLVTVLFTITESIHHSNRDVASTLLLFATARNEAMVWAAICVFGLANGLFLPVITSLVSFEADSRSRGAVMGMFNASSSAGRIVGPALSGPVYFKLGPAAPFVISAVLAVIGAVLLSRVRAKSAAG